MKKIWLSVFLFAVTASLLLTGCDGGSHYTPGGPPSSGTQNPSGGNTEPEQEARTGTYTLTHLWWTNHEDGTPIWVPLEQYLRFLSNGSLDAASFDDLTPGDIIPAESEIGTVAQQMREIYSFRLREDGTGTFAENADFSWVQDKEETGTFMGKAGFSWEQDGENIRIRVTEEGENTPLLLPKTVTLEGDGSRLIFRDDDFGLAFTRGNGVDLEKAGYVGKYCLTHFYGLFGDEKLYTVEESINAQMKEESSSVDPEEVAQLLAEMKSWYLDLREDGTVEAIMDGDGGEGVWWNFRSEIYVLFPAGLYICPVSMGRLLFPEESFYEVYTESTYSPGNTAALTGTYLAEAATVDGKEVPYGEKISAAEWLEHPEQREGMILKEDGTGVFVYNEGAQYDIFWTADGEQVSITPADPLRDIYLEHTLRCSREGELLKLSVCNTTWNLTITFAKAQ